MNTNKEIEEKAELIANGIMIGVQSNIYHTNIYNTNNRCYNHSDLKRASMQMAEWKDEQFKHLVKDYIEIAYNNGQDASLLEDLLTDI